MPADRSRGPEDLGQRYKAVVMQQGRVVLDRDFDALQDIVERQIAADALDEIGPCGTPDNGFAISLPAGAAPAPVAQSSSGPNPLDFLIAPGVMYVGGQRVVLPPPGPSQQPWSYFNQPDWLNPDEPANVGSLPSNLEYVYLHVFEQEVSAVEDPELLDVALGGPDTTQRVRFMWRVERMPTTATDCPTALAQAAATWLAEGYTFDPATMRLLPAARLQVSFPSATTTANLCDPVAQGGYLGAENQLIRMQIGTPVNGQPQLLWGYDNASFIYRVSLQSDGQTLLLAQPPVDAFHCPKVNQFVEVLRSTAILGGTSAEPIRYVAEATGVTAQVQSYTNSDTSVVLTGPLPAPYANGQEQLFLRVWQNQQAITSPTVLTDPTLQTAPGVQVTITIPKGESLPVGAFWMIALRPATPQAVYPERYLNSPQPPDGPRQWVCPLAIIDWEESSRFSALSRSGPQANVLCDCRQVFDNLVDLTKRNQGGCCTVNVKPADAGKLQSIIDAAVANGTVARVCLAPGTYSLPQPLRLGAGHSNLMLEACQEATIFQAQPSADVSPFLDGLIVLVGANGVALRGLQFNQPAVPFQKAIAGRLNEKIADEISQVLPNVETMIGVRMVQSQQVTIAGCTFSFAPQTPFNTIGFGILRTGDCRGMTVKGCQFASATPSTFTRRATNTTDASAPAPAPQILPAFSGPGATPAFSVAPSADVAPVRILPVLPKETSGTVALFGLLAWPTYGIDSPTAEINVDRPWLSVLFDEVVQDNEFNNLTLAINSSARMGTIRVDGNVVTDCVGGFWLTAYSLAPLSEFQQALIITELEEFQALAAFLPLPLGFDAATYQDLRKAATVPPRTSVSISGNRIEAVTDNSTITWGTVLMVLLMPANATDATTSLIVAANNIRGNMRENATPLVMLAYDGGVNGNGSAAVTGNTIVCVGEAPSLTIYPNGQQTDNGQTVRRLAVTGNVFVGRTNLAQLMRYEIASGAGPITTWAPFNSSN